jgi:hypothetical protein
MEGEYLIRSSFVTRMARFTGGYDREIALFMRSDGSWWLRMGGPRFGGVPGTINFDGLRASGELLGILAHTHPTGNLYLSMADATLLSGLIFRRHAVIGPSGAIRWFNVPRDHLGAFAYRTTFRVDNFGRIELMNNRGMYVHFNP